MEKISGGEDDVSARGLAPPAQLEEMIVAESETTYSDSPLGTAIKVTVTSRNSKGGESAPSAPVSGTVP